MNKLHYILRNSEYQGRTIFHSREAIDHYLAERGIVKTKDRDVYRDPYDPIFYFIEILESSDEQ